MEPHDESSKTGPSARLVHVHVCVHCGSAFRREEMEGRSLTSGIFLCPACGLEGPLNVEIRQIEESTDEGPMFPRERSSGQR